MSDGIRPDQAGGLEGLHSPQDLSELRRLIERQPKTRWFLIPGLETPTPWTRQDETQANSL